MDPDVIRCRVFAAHRRARSQVATPRDNFLVYPDEEATWESHTNSVREFSRRDSETVQEFLRSQAAPGRLQGEGPDAATIRKVLGAQRPDQVTEFTHKGMNSADYLPGGAPLVDHLALRIPFMPEWNFLLPAIGRLAQHRLPDVKKPASEREIVLGETSERHVKEILEFLREKVRTTKETFRTCTLAADTESVAIEVADFRRLMEGQPGTNHTVRMAPKGRCADHLPVVFSVGHVGWHVSIKIPTTATRDSGGHPCLRIVPGTLQDGVPAFLKELGIMTGVRLLDDLRDFFKLTRRLYGIDLLEHIAAPLELDRLARLAGYNLTRCGVETLNWICFGTVLPKGMCSRGDGKWHLPWDALPTSLRAYMAADISQCAGAAELFKYFWAIQMFPDLHAVTQVSTLEPDQLLSWWEQHVISRIDSYIQAQPWRTAESMDEVWELLLGSSEHGLVIVGLQPRWPSLVAGGPRFIHTVRAFLIEKLETLREMSPSTWVVVPTTILQQVMFDRRGIQSQPVPTDPVDQLQWCPHPSVKGDLGWAEKINWKMVRNLCTGGVSAKALVLEYTRTNHRLAMKLLERLESHPRAGSTVLGCVERAARLVPSMRSMLTMFNYMPPRPEGWVDPYKEEQARQEKMARLTARAESLATAARNNAEANMRFCCQLKDAVRSAQKRPLGGLTMAHPLLQLISPVGHGATAPPPEERAPASGGPPPKRRRRGPRRSRAERRGRACDPMTMLRESLRNSRREEAATSQENDDDDVVITRVVINNLQRADHPPSTTVSVTAGRGMADGHQAGPLRPPCQDESRVVSFRRPSASELIASSSRAHHVSAPRRGPRGRRLLEIPAGVQTLVDTMEDSGAAAYSPEEETAARRGPWDDERHRREPDSPPLSPTIWAIMRANALPHMEPCPPGGRPG